MPKSRPDDGRTRRSAEFGAASAELMKPRGSHGAFSGATVPATPALPTHRPRPGLGAGRRDSADPPALRSRSRLLRDSRTCPAKRSPSSRATKVAQRTGSGCGLASNPRSCCANAEAGVLRTPDDTLPVRPFPGVSLATGARLLFAQRGPMASVPAEESGQRSGRGQSLGTRSCWTTRPAAWLARWDATAGPTLSSC